MPQRTSVNHIADKLPDRIRGLSELAENLWWSWHPEARMLFKMLDRHTWKESGHNPDLLLRAVSGQTLREAAEDDNYLRHYDCVMSRFDSEIRNHRHRYGECLPQPSPSPVVYFSAEYGLHHSLPFYAGGLGFLAGDHLKECSDLGVPITALGFMYPAGYLRQSISEDGWQENYTQEVDREAASINRVLDENGRQIVVGVPHINLPIHLAVWEVLVGRVSLYLLDTDVPENDPWTRMISQQLYTQDMERRLLQEIILGIGGFNALRSLGISYSMLHLNEGHAAFALLEGLRELCQAGESFREARETLQQRSLFTTHTPVSAGHDVFSFDAVKRYFKTYWHHLGLDEQQFLDLGRHPDHPEAGFNMTVLAMKLSGRRNGVSLRHGKLARSMWQSLWPERASEDVPIESVTNGIHVPTWLEPKMKLLFNRYLPDNWTREQDNPYIWQFLEEIPDEELWRTHYWLKMKLITYVRMMARTRWTRSRVSSGHVLAQGTLLDPAVLTIGFARRFATYKRANLIFQDADRLKRMVNDPWQPIQILFAGKAHPADNEGKKLIQRVFRFACDPEFGGRIAFVENYNEQLAQYMVHGVDVWLNNPQPPMEACGTSGMKAALNGVPHLSVPDGWWLEGFDVSSRNGWSFGADEEMQSRDQSDAEDLYRNLEEEIIPMYYRVSESGTPHEWVRVMKNAIRTNAPRFSATRMVKDYVDRYYRPVLCSGL
jgi:starch phosphorylase